VLPAYNFLRHVKEVNLWLRNAVSGEFRIEMGEIPENQVGGFELVCDRCARFSRRGDRPPRLAPGVSTNCLSQQPFWDASHSANF
jgi:hypothetical protein